MKKKRRPFMQHLSHDDVEDDDKVWDHLDQSLPEIGLIVMYFNGLEKLLDTILCGMFSDRADSLGLIVLQNMQYSAKVNLFSRLSDDLHLAIRTLPCEYEKLLDRLREAAKLRNIVVHADWENTDEEGYTYVNIRFSDGGMEQEYVQLSKDALEEIVEKVLAARKQLGDYWEARDDLMQQYRHPSPNIL